MRRRDQWQRSAGPVKILREMSLRAGRDLNQGSLEDWILVWASSGMFSERRQSPAG
jgi:hypothetical protein